MDGEVEVLEDEVVVSVDDGQGRIRFALHKLEGHLVDNTGPEIFEDHDELLAWFPANVEGAEARLATIWREPPEKMR